MSGVASCIAYCVSFESRGRGKKNTFRVNFSHRYKIGTGESFRCVFFPLLEMRLLIVVGLKVDALLENVVNFAVGIKCRMSLLKV